jgi:hypothetical protein
MHYKRQILDKRGAIEVVLQRKIMEIDQPSFSLSMHMISTDCVAVEPCSHAA